MRRRKHLRLIQTIAETLFGNSLGKVGVAVGVAILGAASAPAETLTLTTGIDTNIYSKQTAVQNTTATTTIDGGGSTFRDADFRQTLVRFDNLFGGGAGQIPIGATINSATYTVITGTGSNDQSGDIIGIYRLLPNASDPNAQVFDPLTAQWANSFGGDGVQINTQANPETAAPDSTRNPGNVISSVVAFDVKSSMTFWGAADNPNYANKGWLVSATAGTNAWVYNSFDNTNAALRPVFTVDYTVDPTLKTVTWNSANATGALNTTTSNTIWLDPSNAAAAFRRGDTISLSQDAAAPVTIAVDAAGVSPNVTNVSHNAGTYTITGGPIASGTLNKSNAGTLVLSSTNNFSDVLLGGGVVQIGANNALGTFSKASLAGGVSLQAPVTQTTSKAFEFVDGTISVAASQKFTIGGNTSGGGTLVKTGAGTLEFTSLASTFTGTLRIDAGRVLLSDIGNGVGTGGDFNATSIVVKNGGAFQFGTDTGVAENPDLPNTTFINVETGGTVDWYIGETFGGVNLQGGALNIRGGGTDLAAGTSSFQSGTVTGFGAARSFSVANGGVLSKVSNGSTTPGDVGGTVTITDADINATGRIEIFGGTLSTNSGLNGTGALLLGDSSTPETTAAPARLQLRGVANDTFTKTINVGAAGGTIDVAEASARKVWSGVIQNAFGGGGPLSKTGPGELSLTGTNLYSGAIAVKGGTLSFTSSAISAGQLVSVSDGANLSKMDTAQSSIAGLTLGTTVGGIVSLTLDPTLSAAPLLIGNTDGFVINGLSKINVSSTGALTVGSTYALIGYQGVLGGAGFAGLSAILPARTEGTLIDNSTAKTVDLKITGFDTITWSGATSAVWNINSAQSWKLTHAGTATTYLQNAVPGDTVTFDDTATVGATTIDLQASVSPASVTFSNATLPYVLNGTGKISGATGIVKTGAGAVTIGTNNDFLGAVTVADGALTFSGNNALAGAITVASGSLAFSGVNTYDGGITVNGGAAAFSGTGSTFNQPVILNAGTMALGGGNTMTAGFQNNGGTLTVTGANTINAVTLSGGTTILSADNALGASGAVLISNNAILRTTTPTLASARGLTFNAGGATIDVPGTNVFSLTGNTAGSGGNDVVTKTGTGTWEIMGASGSGFVGTLEIQQGTVKLQGSLAAPDAGNFNASFINVRPGTKFQFGQTTALTGENPDLPANTVINIYGDATSQGVVDWYVGEDFGGVSLSGGTINYLRGGTNTAAGIDSTWVSGTVNAATTALGIGGAGRIVKAGAATDVVTVNDAAINATGGLLISGGTLSTNGTIVATGDLTFDGGTLQLRHTASFANAKNVVVNPGGGTLNIKEAATAVTLSGIVSGNGTLTKTGPGRLLLTGANTYTGTLNVAEGSLVANPIGISALSTLTIGDAGVLELSSTNTATVAA
ncbi:MAG: autotransporter-associated beta strand repeat-containing protein [Pirellulales bacterium]